MSSRVLVLSFTVEKSPTLLKIAFFVTRHLSELWRGVRPSFSIARLWRLPCSFSRAIHWRNIQKCTVTLDGHSYGGNGENLSFPTFFDLMVIRPRFLNVCFATKVVDLEKLHRKVNFPEVCGDFGWSFIP